MRFRPCIDLHGGRVKQIVGSTLSDDPAQKPLTNFETDCSAAEFAAMYKADNLSGGHVIMLGPGNDEAAKAALLAYPAGLHVGGGINPSNAKIYLDAGASHVIVTSYVFKDGQINWENLEAMTAAVGKNRLVLDLSCKKRDEKYWVVTDRWQNFTDVALSAETFEKLSAYCDEFLIHAAHVEGMKKGVDTECLALIATTCPIVSTYAGGAASLKDLEDVRAFGKNRVDVTVGSALDIFGGELAYRDVVAFCASSVNQN